MPVGIDAEPPSGLQELSNNRQPAASAIGMAILVIPLHRSVTLPASAYHDIAIDKEAKSNDVVTGNMQIQ